MSKSEKKEKKGFSRRKFLVRSSIGLGVILGVGYFSRHSFRRVLADYINTAEIPYVGSTDNPNLWFEITADNQIRLHCPKVEMGQGTFTGLAQIAADELEVDIQQMQVLHAPSSSGNVDEVSTGGSTSISGLWQPLRELAATMREMIKQEAAKMLNVEVASLSVNNGVISAGGQSLSYGAVVKAVKEWTVPKVPPLKSIKDYKFVGQPIPRIDLRDKVLGAPIFGMDASMPDMLFGAIVRPNQIGARYLDADTSAAEQMPGVIKVVKEKDFVGVIAESRMEAEQAKRAIKVQWEISKKWQSQDIEALIEVGKGTPHVIQKKGNAKRVLNNEDGIVSAEYKSPIGAHAQLEPNGAVALVENDRATVIISTQVVYLTRAEVAERLGLEEEQVDIRPTYLGGGFGRRLHTPIAMQTAVLSKAVGRPVKCFFDRKEEFQNDTFRPPTHHTLRAKLKENGLIKAMEHHVSSGDVMYGSPLVPGIAEPILGADLGAWRGGMIQYGKIPHFQAVSWRVKLPFATSWWRSLGLLANTFAIECFLDELAVQGGQDPVQFRLSQIQEDERGHRLKEVIKAAAKKANWSNEVTNGRAMGFAASTDANTPVAQVVEVSVDNKEIKVHKVVCAIDPGIAINPDQIRAQCEGSIIMGLSASLYEAMSVEDGALSPTNYGPYRMALMKNAPKEIEVVILENAEAPGAVGEPPLGPIGAAIANAVFRLTQQRLRSLPLKLA
ncbi:MAG: molybdopterin cofactor-binding domain-containing protein [Bacteroidota bacterium]